MNHSVPSDWAPVRMEDLSPYLKPWKLYFFLPSLWLCCGLQIQETCWSPVRWLLIPVRLWFFDIDTPELIVFCQPAIGSYLLRPHEQEQPVNRLRHHTALAFHTTCRGCITRVFPQSVPASTAEPWIIIYRCLHLDFWSLSTLRYDKYYCYLFDQLFFRAVYFNPGVTENLQKSDMKYIPILNI